MAVTHVTLTSRSLQNICTGDDSGLAERKLVHLNPKTNSQLSYSYVRHPETFSIECALYDIHAINKNMGLEPYGAHPHRSSRPSF